ncbi:alpha/beta hydrolase family protein [Metabacillus litoralis]|uniref:alpha/beta hydrolase family protein n=1 Tax=Metabacillus litoralis TaxID=152268 RepID=UPI001CFE88FC|nr:alpha/beta hydrolase [Metabacillus litoralis]
MSRTINISYGEHSSQFGVLRIPDSNKPSKIIVLIHGGFWQSKFDLEENNPIAKDLTSRGYATWNIEYRRVGEEGGGWKGTFNDVIDAINQLYQLKEAYNLDLTNVNIIGHSAGGHLALWVASRVNTLNTEQIFNKLIVPVKKVVSLAGVTDLNKMWEYHEGRGIKSLVAGLMGGPPKEFCERYKAASPKELTPLNIEHVLVHGELDRHVPVELSKDYYLEAVKKGSNVKLLILPNVEHFKIIDPTSTAWESVISVVFDKD